MQVLIIPALFLLQHLQSTVSAQLIPISQLSDYVTARVCVKNAVTGGMYYGTAEEYLGCGQQQSQTCLCGSVGSVSAQLNAYIYSKASTSCGDTIEASSAAAIFHEYCTGSGTAAGSNTLTADSASHTTTTAANPQSKPTSPGAVSTSTGSSSNNNENNGGSSTNNINIKTGGGVQASSSHVPIIAGISVGLAVLTALGLSCWLMVRRRRNRGEKSSSGAAFRTDANVLSDSRRRKPRNSWHRGHDDKWEGLHSEVELPDHTIHELHGR